MVKLYPLRLEAQLKEKVWGGHWLAEELGRPSEKGALLGESWEAFSGSVILNGEWQGRTLGELYQEFQAEVGGEVAKAYPEFPLLVKFIEARENLSVQVHPNDQKAQQLENYRSGKTEMWYVIAAEPGAYILYGLNDKASSLDELDQALRNEKIVDYMNRVEVKKGDVVYLPSGTVHALCAGVVVYELQQESDITYRLYDWGRQGREIHVEKGLQVINLEARNLEISHPQPHKHNGRSEAALVDCPYFYDELLEVSDQSDFPATGKSFSLLSSLSGAGTIYSGDGEFEPETIQTGDTFLIPARLSFSLKTDNQTEPLRVILAQAKA